MPWDWNTQDRGNGDMCGKLGLESILGLPTNALLQPSESRKAFGVTEVEVTF